MPEDEVKPGQTRNVLHDVLMSLNQTVNTLNANVVQQPSQMAAKLAEVIANARVQDAIAVDRALAIHAKQARGSFIQTVGISAGVASMVVLGWVLLLGHRVQIIAPRAECEAPREEVAHAARSPASAHR